MVRLLIVYGTTDGQTAKIARFVAKELEDLGASVEVVEASIATANPYEFAGTIVAGSIHAGGYQRSLRRWVRAHAEQLSVGPAAMLTVCLGILQDDGAVRRDLSRIFQRFQEQTGWVPARHRFVAGALRYTRYGWFKRMVMKWIAGKAGGSIDTSRDHEYTDWDALGVFAEEFAADCGLLSRVAPGRIRSPTVAETGTV